jgi:hypothetical protein
MILLDSWDAFCREIEGWAAVWRRERGLPEDLRDPRHGRFVLKMAFAHLSARFLELSGRCWPWAPLAELLVACEMESTPEFWKAGDLALTGLAERAGQHARVPAPAA